MFGPPDGSIDTKLEMGWQGFMCMGTSLHEEEEYEEALGAFTEAINLCPYVAESYLYRGLCFSLLEDFSKAIADYTDAMRLDPAEQMAVVHRGISYFQLEDYDRALEDVDRSFDLGPGCAVTYFMRGCLHLLQDELDEAVQDFEAALVLEPDDDDSRMNRISAYEAASQWWISSRAGISVGKIIPTGSGVATAQLNRGFGMKSDTLIREVMELGEVGQDQMQNIILTGIDLEQLVNITQSTGFILSTR